MGDVLLLQGESKQILELQSENTFDVLGKLDPTRYNRRQAWLVVAIFAGCILAGSLILIPILIAMILGSLLKFVTRSISPYNAYRQMEWKALILIGYILSLGTTMQ